LNEIKVVTDKTFKEFARNKMELMWTFLVPIFFLIIIPFMYSGVPAEMIVCLKGGLTLTMMNFLFAFVGQANLAGSIASDRAKGLYLKMNSMPVKPWKEGIGRIVALWIFSIFGAILLVVVGLLYGAYFTYDFTVILGVIGLVFIVFLMTAGTGFLIASFIKGESAATHTGVAITLLVYFVGGMAFPYANLPSFMQIFTRIHPVSSANAMMIYLLEGETVAGYNPFTLPQLILTTLLAVITFVVGLILYSKSCWKNNNKN
jgi:ABC-2 type transport system permease protein